MKSALALAFLAVAAATDPHGFQFQRPVDKLPAAQGQVCLAVDPTLFGHAASGLADLRLFHDGTETPYLIHKVEPPAPRPSPIAPRNLGIANGQVGFDAAMPDSTYTDIDLAVTGHDFLANVHISGSQLESGGQQRDLGAFTIFDLTAQRLGRSTVIHLPESDFPFLHFRIDGPIAPGTITGITVLEESKVRPVYINVAKSTQSTLKDRNTLFQFTLPPHTPVDLIEFAAPALPANFSRGILVTATPVRENPTAPNAAPEYGTNSEGEILRVHSLQGRRRIDEERLAVEAPQVDFDKPSLWTVTVENGDDAPLAIAAVSLKMVQRDLCFDASGSGAYTLLYGNPSAYAPSYDYARLNAAQPSAARAELGSESPNPVYQPPADTRPFTEKHPVLLWSALILVIAALGAVAYRSMRSAG